MGFRSRGLLALTLAFFVATIQFTETVAQYNPFDIYFVIDQSGSIADNDPKCQELRGMTCMNVLADFANRTQTRLGELVGHYFVSPKNNGLRVAIVMFRCKNFGETPKILLNPSGNLTEIALGFETLKKQVANKPATCAETAMTAVQTWVAEQSSVSPPQRKTAVLYLTDGQLERKDAIATLNLATNIREANTTQIFGVSIGGDTKQNEEIGKITGDMGLIFDAADPTALSDIIDSIAAYMLGDFQASLRGGQSPSSVCLGETPFLQITGTSVSVIRGLECEFTMEGLPDTKTAPIIKGGSRNPTTGVWECPFPQSFYTSARGETVVVKVFGVEEGLPRRQLGTDSTTFVLGRRSCLNVDSNTPDGRCLMDSTIFDLNGVTLQEVLNSTGTYSFTCFFTLDSGVTLSTIGFAQNLNAVSCMFPKETVNQLFGGSTSSSISTNELGEVKLISPLEIVEVQLQADYLSPGYIPGTLNRTIHFIGLPPPDVPLLLNDPKCLDRDMSAWACWRRQDQATATFNGQHVRAFLEAAAGSANLKVACIIRSEDESSSNVVYARRGSSNSEVVCDLPSEYIEPRLDGQRTWNISSDLLLLNTKTKQAIRGSMRFNTTQPFEFLPCVSLEPSNANSYCFGDQIITQINALSEVPLLPSDSQHVQCVFKDSTNGIESTGLISSLTLPRYECISEASVDVLLGYNFDTVEIRSFGRTLIAVDLQTNGEGCLKLLSRNSVTEVYVSQTPAVKQCWGESKPFASLLLQGQTADKVKGSDLSCFFKSETGFNITSPAVYNAESQGLVCTPPTAIFLLAEGDFTMTLQILMSSSSGLQRSLWKGSLTVETLTSRPCFETEVFPLNQLEGAPLCVGTPAGLRVFGTSLPTLAKLLKGREDTTCVFSDSSESKAVVNGNLTCGMPEQYALKSRSVVALRVGGLVTIPISTYSVTKADQCFKPSVDISEQSNRIRRSLQTVPVSSNYCLGDGFATQVEGDTIQFILERYGAKNITCEWEVDKSANFVDSSQPLHFTTPTMVGNSKIVCSSKTWDPFTVSGISSGVYSSVTIRLNPTNDVIGEKVDFTSPKFNASPQVCSTLSGWGDSIKAEEQDCMRASVEISLAGRSAVRLNQPPQNTTFSCWNSTKLQDSAVLCTFIGQSGSKTMFQPSFSGTDIVCKAPGWRPDSPGEGNYVEIRMEVCLDDGTTRVVKRQSFEPTARRSCLYLSHTQNSCVGQSVNATIAGPTLTAYAAYAKENDLSFSELAGCVGESLANNTQTGNDSISCTVLEHFLPPDANNLAVSIPVSFRFGKFGEIRTPEPVTVRMFPTNTETCVNAVLAETKCTGVSKGTEVGITGLVPASALTSETLLQDLSCVFYDWTPSSRRDGTLTIAEGTLYDILCTDPGTFRNFSIMYKQTGELLSGPIHRDNRTCTDEAIAPTGPPTNPGNDDGNNLGAILGGVFAGLLLVLLIIFFVVRKRTKDKQIEKGNSGVPEVIIEDSKAVPVDEPQLQSFAIGDRVEANIDFESPSEGSNKTWHKGTIIGEDTDGHFKIEFDHLKGDSFSVLPPDLRLPLSDYQLNDPVEVRYGGGVEWHAAVIRSVGPNNTYTVRYDDENLSTEDGVPGHLVRDRVMIFPAGSVVDAKLSRSSSRYTRGCVQSVDATAEMYEINFLASAIGDTSEKERNDQVLLKVPAEDVRLFCPSVGEHFDVHFDETVVRGVVQTVNLEDQTCSMRYDTEITENISAHLDKVVPWSVLHRPTFHVGQLVRAKTLSEATVSVPSSGRKKEQRWLPGKISGVQEGRNLYTVEFEDESIPKEDNIPVDRLRPANMYDGHRFGQFAIGELVKVKLVVPGDTDSDAGRTWYKAKIDAVNDDGSYGIQFEKGPKAGKKESRVPADRIKPFDELDEDEVNFQTSNEIPDVFRPPPRDHPQASEDDGLQVPFHLRFKKRKPLEYMELPNNRFEVMLDMSEGLGLSLGWTNDNRVIVAGFRDLPNGDWGPVEACGLVGLKDQLLEVNSTSISGKSFVEVSELIKNSGKTIKLQFGRWNDDEQILPSASA